MKKTGKKLKPATKEKINEWFRKLLKHFEIVADEWIGDWEGQRDGDCH